ncbi:CYP enzymes assisting alcohol dehydrogenase-like [Humulus lupulus]|uniref:CYP enzymes assisting alcohol dehydrogenase-like n=1 Tax=Humulus lupulus TaxID=3486 RepID=UPI002B4132B8|nr:CYP enzymes assisting alcohol dehydrogenase-like [Humulus lupulus]XP_062119712.1 CYP enzymes assisting alcohol dehydrogenase-like [Humulus lupulus]
MSEKKSSQLLTCKAVVCWGMGEAPKLEGIQVEAPKQTEVRLKMIYASVCHTDNILCTKGFPIPLFPRVLGHEGVGVVESIGEDVTSVKQGDLVIPTYVSECNECENCLSEKTNMCLKHPLTFSGLMLDGTSRMSANGQLLYHTFSCSTWSEYTVVDANFVAKLGPAPPNTRHASFLSCGFTAGFGAPWKEAAIEEGSSVAVIGLGAVGLGAVEGSRIRGASRIIGVDKNQMKKGKGEAFGITDFINPILHSDKSVSELIKDLTGGIGVDYCFECTGLPHLINEALEATKTGKGKAITIGLSYVTSVQISSLALLSGKTLKGSIFAGLRAKTDLPLVIEKWRNEEFQLDELCTHQVQMTDINKAFQLLEQEDCVKVLIKI